MGLFKGIIVAAALALASPVWAGGDHGHRGHHHGGHGHHHGWKHHKHHYQHGHRHWQRAPRYTYYERHYYAPPPPPVYSYAPAPGVHIVTPHIYIPLR
jgi:hypothetical protein